MSSDLKMQTSWLDQPIFSRVKLNWENILFAIILVIAVISRFYDLESRVMSHDENTHVYYSWRFSRCTTIVLALISNFFLGPALMTLLYKGKAKDEY